MYDIELIPTNFPDDTERIISACVIWKKSPPHESTLSLNTNDIQLLQNEFINMEYVMQINFEV